MVAVPTLAGAVLRIVNGLLGDRIGQKLTGTLNQLIVMRRPAASAGGSASTASRARSRSA